MVKHKLTFNTLAMGNLKHRRKQYAIMIIGILLAMVFSSSMLFFIFSLNASNTEMKRNLYGTQNAAYFEADEDIVKEAYDKGFITDYGFAHVLGYVYTENEELGSAVAWADERFKKVQYQSLLEGDYPTSDGEIAAEKATLVRLGVEPKIGEKVKVKLKVQNGMKWFDEPVEKEYTVVGILRDKKSNFFKNYYTDDKNVKLLPSIFVAENTLVESGGKENTVCYCIITNMNKLWEDDSKFNKFLQEKGIGSFYETDHFMDLDSKWMSSGIGDLGNKVGFAVVLAVVLLVASGLIIINSFNANLKERKKQIGMLRAVGTTRHQIITIFSREALIISLFCAPISLVISILGVKLISKLLFDETFVFVAKWWILIVCILFSIVAVMVAALIPLFSASKISPMQAIRNIDTSRKLKNKKVKTQKEFKTESLLAKRSQMLHKGSRFAVIFMLIITIVTSCLGFTELKDEYQYEYNTGYDYSFWGINDGYWSALINYDKYSKGFSENDRQEMLAFPYIKTADGSKGCQVNLVIPEYSDYFTALSGPYSDIFYYNDTNYGDEWDMPTTKAEWEKYFATREYEDVYKQVKQKFNVQGEYYPTNITASSPSVVEQLNDIVKEGKLDVSKLNTGEEIILVAPKKTAFVITEDKKYGGYIESTVHDKSIKDNVEYFVEGELPYRVGDKIQLDVLTAQSPYDIENEEEENYAEVLPADTKLESKEVTIGAIILRDDYDEIETALNGSGMWNEFNFITTTQGLEHFAKGVKYTSMEINSSVKLDDEADELIMQFLDSYAVKLNVEVNSNYASQKESKSAVRTLIMSLAAIIILFFAISASIINNTLAASIRENKREIGTLRAVGASSRELVMSYIKQLISMFAWGYGLGFLITILIFLGMFIYSKLNEGDMKISIVVLPAIILCILLFIICSINLWAKVRKEMKNSIVENIREL